MAYTPDKARRGAGGFDSLAMLRSSGTLSSTPETGTGISIYETPAAGMTAKVVVPSVSGTSPTLKVEIQDSDNDTDYATIAALEGITEAGEYDIRFATKKRYLRHYITLGGTTPNFGVTLIGLVAHGH